MEGRARSVSLRGCLLPVGACLLAVALAVGATGCEDDRAEESIAATIDATRAAMADAFVARDEAARRRQAGIEAAGGPLRQLCRLLSRDAEIVLGHAQHGTFPLDCHEDVYRFVDSLRPYENGRQPRLLGVDGLTPETAAGAFRLPSGDVVTLPLSREGNAWRLDGIFDASIAETQTSADPGHPELPSKRELAVEGPSPRDLTRQRCTVVEDRRFPTSAGGCATKLEGTMRLTLLTAFGYMPFGRCRIEGVLRVDAAGNGWLDDVRFHGGSPCNDTASCSDVRDRPVPWRVRLAPAARGDAGSRLTVAACVDSCFGRFEGAWPLRLERLAGAWRLSSDAVVGTSGLRVDGALLGPTPPPR